MNELIQTIIETIKFALPAVVVYFTVRTMLQKYFDNQIQLKQLELIQQTKQQHAPLKIQAYERLILLCERIAIDALLRRTTEATTAAAAYFTIVHTINAEFEHNITQQMYVSQSVWRSLTDAKSQTLQIITTAYNQVQPTDPAQKLEEKILQQLLQAATMPQQTALAQLKTEVAQIIY
jgi:hypothetical protein